MPIKLPKFPQRRKSSGNVLDTLDEPSTTSSFRVLNREEVDAHTQAKVQDEKPKIGKRSMSGPFGHVGRTKSLDISKELDQNSGRTNHSVSTTGGSSIHFSNDSTQPSSISSASQDDLSISDKPSPFENTAPALRSRPSIDQLKSAISGTFRPKQKKSFELLSASSSGNMLAQPSSDLGFVAPEVPRATASPTKRSDVDMDDNIFDGMPDRNSFLVSQSVGLARPPQAKVASDSNLLTANPYIPRSRSPSPSPTKAGAQPREVLHRTKSWETDASREGFLARSSSPAPSISPVRDAEEPLLQQGHSSQPSLEEPDVVLDALYASELLEQRHGSSSPASAVYSDVQQATPVLRKVSPASTQTYTHIQETSTRSTPRARQPPSSYRPPPTTLLSPYDDSITPPSLDARHSRLLPPGQKVMTPAEFKRYKESREKDAQNTVKIGTEDDEPTYEDEEDELERKQLLAKQRKKQEAHLSVWRQQMRKVTGELPERPKIETTQSYPDLFAGPSSESVDANGNAATDEDEDIPLGILQAHGFPNNGRPPTKPTSMPATPRMASYPAPAGTTRNDPAAGGGGSLPPFARGLPADPFVGANLAMPSDRRSLAFSNNAPLPSMQPRQPSPNRPQMPVFGPPGGLIGIIAEEERARAARRQSSNMLNFNNMMLPGNEQVQMPMQPQAALAYNPGMNASTLSLQQPMQQPMQSPASATEQAHVQMSNSMTQMMQVQMQWMQQMMHMQGISPGPASPEAPLPQARQSADLISRPQSTFGLPLAAAGPSQIRPTHSRNPSSTSTAALNQASNQIRTNTSIIPPRSASPAYAPSIAPSERSNIGQPARYRPVSAMATAPPSNISNYDLARKQAIHNNPITQRQSRMYSSQDVSGTHLSPIDPNRAVNRQTTKQDKGKQPVYKAQIRKQEEDEEDEEEAWAELKRKTAERKEKWRVSRSLAKLMPGLPPVGVVPPTSVATASSEEQVEAPQEQKQLDDAAYAQDAQQSRQGGLPEGAYAFVTA